MLVSELIKRLSALDPSANVALYHGEFAPTRELRGLVASADLIEAPDGPPGPTEPKEPTMSTTYLVTESNGWEIADDINAKFEAGTVTHIGSIEIKSRWGRPVATCYGTGTVSVSVQARTTKGFNDLYFAVGRTFTVS